jgi:hypothetical protein
MDGLIVIKSVMLSNEIAETNRYYRTLSGMAKTYLYQTQEQNAGFKEAALIEGIEAEIIHKIRFQRHQRQS